VNGTLSVFESAIQTEGVKRVVLTSSFAAISGGSKEGTWTEDDWNTTSSLESGSYPYSKTMAERAAWEFMKNRDTSFDLIVINPTGVIGPSIVSRINQTHEFFSNMTKGEYPGIIGFEFPFVDVRDVARAHILAMETPRAAGRYITSAGTASFRHMVDSPTRLDMARNTSFRACHWTPRLETCCYVWQQTSNPREPETS